MKTFREFVAPSLDDRAKNAIHTVILHDHHYTDDSSVNFFVWRLGTSGSLDNRNAGDIFGIAKFSSSNDAEFTATGEFLFLFQVTNPSRKFGPYQRYRHGQKQSSDTMIGRSQDPIKWGIGRDYATWYSFPAGGEWSAHVVKKIPMSTLSAMAKKLNTYIGGSELVDAVLFYEAATGKTLI